jgi:hypothetical protein
VPPARTKAHLRRKNTVTFARETWKKPFVKTIAIECLLLTGIGVMGGSLANENAIAESPKLALAKTLDARGAFVSLEGQYLFLTNGIDNTQTEQRAGSWFGLAADPGSPELLGATLPPAWQVAIKDDYAFICDYTKFLTVHDIHGRQWKSAAKLPMPGQTENIMIRGNLAYIANHTAGLTVVDISEPSAPAIISNFNPGIDCDAIALWKDSAILYGHWESRLVVVDVSDPSKLHQTGIYQNAPKTFIQGEMEVAGGFAYCTAVNSLVIVNLTAPSYPKLASALPFKSTTTDVAILDGYAFVAAGDGLHVLDLSNPANPAEAAMFPQPCFQVAATKAKTGEYYIYATARKGPTKILRFRP